MDKSPPLTINNLLDIGEQMAAELQTFAAEAERAGSPLADVQQIIERWEVLYRLSGRSWMAKSADSDHIPSEIDNL